MPNPTPPALQIVDLHLAYPGDTGLVLKGATLAIAPDQIYGLLGKPGSGKTSLLRAAAGRLAPKGGSIAIFGQADHSKAHQVRHAWLQGDPLPEPQPASSTGGEFLELAAALEIFPHRLGDLERLPHTLQARARLIPLLLDPSPLLLLDEHPGLTPETAVLLQDWLPDHVHARGQTLVLATQHPTLIQKLCDRAAVLQDGRIAYAGPVSRHPGPAARSTYWIRLGGRLDSARPGGARWPAGVEVTAEGDETLIAGEIPDQAALFGLLACARDLGLTLVSIQQQAPDPIDRWRAWMKPNPEGFSPPTA